MDIVAFKTTFGFNPHRLFLLSGLEKAIRVFKSLELDFLYVDGSFVSTKNNPSDYDICYEIDDANLNRLFFFYPVFRDFNNERKLQKKIFYGEFFPATWIAAPPKEMYLSFFQNDKDDNPKGIVKLFI